MVQMLAKLWIFAKVRIVTQGNKGTGGWGRKIFTQNTKFDCTLYVFGRQISDNEKIIGDCENKSMRGARVESRNR